MFRVRTADAADRRAAMKRRYDYARELVRRARDAGRGRPARIGQVVSGARPEPPRR